MDDPGVGVDLSPDVDEPLLDEVRPGAPQVRRGAAGGIVDARVVGDPQRDAVFFRGCKTRKRKSEDQKMKLRVATCEGSHLF